MGKRVDVGPRDGYSETLDEQEPAITKQYRGSWLMIEYQAHDGTLEFDSALERLARPTVPLRP